MSASMPSYESSHVEAARQVESPPTFSICLSGDWNSEEASNYLFIHGEQGRTKSAHSQTGMTGGGDGDDLFSRVLDFSRMDCDCDRESLSDIETELIQQQHKIMQDIHLELQKKQAPPSMSFGDRNLTVASTCCPLSSDGTCSMYLTSSNVSLSRQSNSVTDSPISDSSVDDNSVLQDYYNDPKKLEEQCRIMDEIERDLYQKFHKRYDETPLANSQEEISSSLIGRSSKVSVEEESTPTRCNKKNLVLQSRRAAAPQPSSCEDSIASSSSQAARSLLRSEASSKDAKAAAFTQDTRFRNFHGRNTLYVRGTEKTMNAVAQGIALIVQCPVCHSMLQVSKDAKLLFCTQCQAVSAMDLAKTTTGGDDSRIAHNVQRQEMERALTRKMMRRRSRRDCRDHEYS